MVHGPVQVLEWIVDVLAFVSNWQLTQKRRQGWALAFASEVMWVLISVITAQWAFALAAVVFGVMDIRGWRTWKPEAEEEECPEVRISP